MRNYSKYSKLALVLTFSIAMTVFVQGGSLSKDISPQIISKTSASEKAVNKSVPRKEKSKENSTEKAKIKSKATEKPTQKPTSKQKATEKPTQKPTSKQKATEKPTQKPTSEQKATEKPTQVPTMVPTEEPSIEISVGGVLTDNTSLSKENATAKPTAPTDPPTEWSQELQDSYDYQLSLGYMFAIDTPDYTYQTGQVTLSEEDFKLACQIVYGEAGGEGLVGCCLVAQCLKDSMVFLNYSSIKDVQKYCQYDGWKENYSETAEQAVNLIFNQNRSAVAHRLLYFYATDLCVSEWHETQYHVLTRGNSRFFDMW